MIWFYPLNELEISGYEAFVVTIFSPILTSVGLIFEFSRSIHGMAFLRALSLVGVASFQAPTTLMRLVLLAFGCGTAMLWFCGIVWSKDAKERYMHIHIDLFILYSLLNILYPSSSDQI